MRFPSLSPFFRWRSTLWRCGGFSRLGNAISVACHSSGVCFLSHIPAGPAYSCRHDRDRLPDSPDLCLGPLSFRQVLLRKHFHSETCGLSRTRFGARDRQQIQFHGLAPRGVRYLVPSRAEASLEFEALCCDLRACFGAAFRLCARDFWASSKGGYTTSAAVAWEANGFRHGLQRSPFGEGGRSRAFQSPGFLERRRAGAAQVQLPRLVPRRHFHRSDEPVSGLPAAARSKHHSYSQCEHVPAMEDACGCRRRRGWELFGPC